MKYPLAVVAIAAAAFTMSACTSERSATDLPPGQYHSKATSTDANDTTRTSETDTTVGYDANGHKRAVVQKKKTTDPKGLFNESTSESQQVIEK